MTSLKESSSLFVEPTFIPEIPPMEEKDDVSYEILDLAINNDETLRRTMKLLASAKRIVIIVGAGISVAAGIPDFRSSGGLFATLKADAKYKPSGKQLFDASVYTVSNPHKF
jgi:NAD+-dependent protein deacetylase SIR2